MLYVKMMFTLKQGCDATDHFRIVTIGDGDLFEFNPPPEDAPWPSYATGRLNVARQSGKQELHYVEGTCYVMNESGKTIAQHSVYGNNCLPPEK